MFRKKSSFLVALTLAASVALTGCGASSEPAASNNNSGSTGSAQPASSTEPIKIKVGFISPQEHGYTMGLEGYAKKLEEATNGQVKLELFGNGQLGGEREMTEQIQLGTLDMGLITSGPVGNFVPELSVLEMPFIFRDLDHVYKTLDGEIGQELLSKLEDSGIKGLALWENGMRHLSNNKRPIQTPEDVKGLKMRTIENDIFVDTFKALGADATPIAFPEVYTSFQQGVVDGFDAAYGVFESSKMYEVQKQWTELNIFYSTGVLMINKEKFDSLPANVQEAMVKLGLEVAPEQRKLSQELEKKQKANMAANGVQMIDLKDVNIELFREAVQPVYEKHSSRFGDYVQRIQAIQ